MVKIVLNTDIRRILIFNQIVWSAAYDVIWSASTKLPGPQAFQPVVMAAVAVVMAPFFAAIIIATRQAVGASSPGDVVLMSLVGLRQTRFGEIIDCSEKRCCMAL